MADVVARPFWVRCIVSRRAARNEVLIRCWFLVVASVLSLPFGISGYRWAWVSLAVMAETTIWGWLAFFWIDRHRAWPRPDP